MANSKFANNDGQSAFGDSTTVPACWSGTEHAAPHKSGAVVSKPVPQEQTGQLAFVGVMPLIPSRKARWARALILLLKAVLLACAAVLAFDS